MRCSATSWEGAANGPCFPTPSFLFLIVIPRLALSCASQLAAPSAGTANGLGRVHPSRLDHSVGGGEYGGRALGHGPLALGSGIGFDVSAMVAGGMVECETTANSRLFSRTGCHLGR